MNPMQQVMQPRAAAAQFHEPQPRLVKAAHEFEAAMMKELLSPLEPGNDTLGTGDEGSSGSSSALSSFAGEALGQAISQHGGFGVATRIIHQLSQQTNHRGSGEGGTVGSSGGNRFGNSGGISTRAGLP